MKETTLPDEALTACDTLRFSPKWLDCGFLGENALRKYMKIFETSEDKNREHYRYGAFRSVLAAHDHLTDTQVAQYVELAELDDDPLMARAALSDLISLGGLTDAQLSWAAAQPAFAAPLFQKAIRRRRLLDALHCGPVTDETFERCLASGDAVVQGAMLEVSSIAPAQIELLGEHGASRAVRNMAKARLRRREKTHG